MSSSCTCKVDTAVIVVLELCTVPVLLIRLCPLSLGGRCQGCAHHLFLWPVYESWLRTNGVSTNGTAAKVMNFDRLGKEVRGGTLGGIKAG